MHVEPGPDRPRSDGATHHAESADRRRREIGSDLAHTVLATAARRLAEAIAEYDAAIDRGASLHELRLLDHDVASAERDHVAAGAPLTPVPPAS